MHNRAKPLESKAKPYKNNDATLPLFSETSIMAVFHHALIETIEACNIFLVSKEKFKTNNLIVAFPDADCSLRFVEPSCSDEKQSVSPSPQQILLTAYVYQGGVRGEDSDTLFRSPTNYCMFDSLSL